MKDSKNLLQNELLTYLWYLILGWVLRDFRSNSEVQFKRMIMIMIINNDNWYC